MVGKRGWVVFVIIGVVVGASGFAYMLLAHNLYPVVDAGEDQHGGVGETMYFMGYAEDSDGWIVKYEWDFDGDGVYEHCSDENEMVTYNYNTPGNYTAFFRVTDNDGGSSIDSCNITITETLSFTIEPEKLEYAAGERIVIEAELKNIGNESVNVSGMGIGLGPPTLDFEITTPDGRVIHFLGPFALTMPSGVRLAPGDEHNYTAIINEPFWKWGNDDINSYNFTTPGEYRVKGVYKSSPSKCLDITVWEGILYSNVITFTITP